MSLFSKVFKSKDNGARSKSAMAGQAPVPAKPKWEEAWSRTSVKPEEVEELLHVCTQELKSRALDMPFIILPFRPESDPSASRTFVRNFFKTVYGESTQYKGESLRREARLHDPIALCSIMKWCWARLPGGVVGWEIYELFKQGETKANMAKHAFDTFIPISAGSEARSRIIFDFFDLLAAISANGKTNGLGGRKLSRLAGWWAFEHVDTGKGFEGGYKSWARAANATSHLYFAYLRSKGPEGAAAIGGISGLPRSLQALVTQTEYPPETPSLLESSAPKVVMIVDRVSPTPYSLLRRAKNFDYNDDDQALRKFAEYDDPVRSLTFECRRVINAISNTNTVNTHTSPAPETTTSPVDSSWSRFEDVGFGSFLSEKQNGTDVNRAGATSPPPLGSPEGLRSTPSTGYTDLGRPTTPSWADFMSSGFADDSAGRGPASLLLPPSQILPPLGAARDIHSSQSHVRNGYTEDLEPGELASVSRMDLDETFWWVWMSSLAGEETSGRKAVFGRCAFIETEIRNSRWFIVEEQVKGASEPEVGAVIVEKKSRFSWTRRGRSRRDSDGKAMTQPTRKMHHPEPLPSLKPIGAEKKAKIDAAAAALIQGSQKSNKDSDMNQRRGRADDGAESKTNSVMTLQPVIMSEAGPAMQWARKFDKEAVRAKYLGDSGYGRGSQYEPETATINSINGPAGSDGLQKTTTATTAGATEQPPVTPVPSSPPAVATQHSAISSPISPKSLARDGVSSTRDLNHAHRKQLSKEQNENLAQNGSAAHKPAQPAAPSAAQPLDNGLTVTTSLDGDGSPNGKLEKSKKGSTRGLKNLFNRGKKEEPEAVVAHRRMMENKAKLQVLPETEKSVERKPSKLWRQKDKAGATGVEEAPAAEASKAPPAPASIDLEGGEPGPMVGGEEHREEHREEPRVESHEVEHHAVPAAAPTLAPAGVLAHTPAHAPDTAPSSSYSNTTAGAGFRDALQSQHSHQNSQDVQSFHDGREYQTQAAIRLDPELDDDYDDNDVPTPTAERSMSPEPSIAQKQAHEAAFQAAAAAASKDFSTDRWAQIRKNASERKSVEQDTSSRPSVARTDKTDDGETSGEETIESRVARIKARVAELTANQNLGGAQH